MVTWREEAGDGIGRCMPVQEYSGPEMGNGSLVECIHLCLLIKNMLQKFFLNILLLKIISKQN